LKCALQGTTSPLLCLLVCVQLGTTKREEWLLSAKETTMFTSGDYQIVVTYRDSNYLWKDRAVNSTDMTDTEINPTERVVHCFTPNFWGRFSHPSCIERVMVTLKGHTFRLPWRAAMNLAVPSALSLDILLHYDGHEMPTGVTWN
jgi:hypothetical protein